VKLTQASLADFEIIFEILSENARWLESKNIVQWPLTWLESKHFEIKESVKQGHFFHVEIDNEVAAIVELRITPEEVWGSGTAPALYIHKFAIRREYSDQGLGRKVLALIAAAGVQQGLKYLRLDCVAHNSKLRQYYRSCGFELIRVVKMAEVNLALYEHELTTE
jgi:ribosomal protein S18 acetylase RimI-like enzyme